MTQSNESRIDRIEAVILQVAQQQQTNTEAIKVIVEQVDVMAEKVDVMAEKVDLMAEKVDLMAEKVDLMAEKVDVMAEKVDVMAEKVDVMAEKVDALSTDMQDFVKVQSAIIDISETDRATFQAEIRRIWEYLLNQQPNNGRGER
jgi:methyl-accepting chemotaxis protein